MQQLEASRAEALRLREQAAEAMTEFHTLVREAHAEGMNMNSVARHFDVSRQAVTKWIREGKVRRPN